MEPMTPDQIKKLLQKYYDIPQMIDEEFSIIRHLKIVAFSLCKKLDYYRILL